MAPQPASSAPTAAGPTLSRRALYEDVADRLRAQIFSRTLEPGTWIDEMKLAAEYGISRTPLREALKVLAVEGLVAMKPRRGAYVAEMSRDDVAQIYHLLALLDIAGNRWRTQIVTDLRKVMKLNRHHSLFKQGRLADSLAKHRALMAALMAALLARKGAQTTALMREHFANGLEAAG